MTSTVFVVDDHPVVRDGVTLLLRSDPMLTIIGSAESGRAAIERVTVLRPDLVLLDLRLPDMLAPEVISRTAQSPPWLQDRRVHGPRGPPRHHRLTRRRR